MSECVIQLIRDHMLDKIYTYIWKLNFTMSESSFNKQ